MTRPLRRRPWGVAIVLALLLAACTADPGPDRGPGPEGRFAEFAAAWQAGDTEAASALTSEPAAADLLLDEVDGNLHPEELTITAGAVNRTGTDAAITAATLSWTLPDAGTWTYEATWNWRRVDGEWLLDWSPTVVHPKLGERQTLGSRITEAPDGVVVDRNDQQLVAPVRVYSVVLLAEPGANVAATAAALAPVLQRFDKTITAKSIVAGVRAAVAEATEAQAETPGEPDPDATASSAPPTTGSVGAGETVQYTVINLREPDYQGVQAELAAIPGLAFPSELRNLPPTKEFARLLLGELEPTTTELTTGVPGWKVMVVDTTGGALETLAEEPPKPGQRVVVTLDSRIQQAAEEALAGITQPAVLLAMQPSTGEILAVAQNAPANDQGMIALTGRYPPGSTFKVVTATAALERDLIAPGRVIDCPGRVVIDGRLVRNSNEFVLGSVDATLAFARSCNTTFAMLSSQMPATALPEAAQSYGVGLDFVITGITTLTGSVPAGESTVQRAENGFGQGEVLLTPFGALLMAATAANGEMPTPVIIRGTPTTVDRPAPARPAQIQQTIQDFMRAVVEQGTAVALQDLGDVHAKTGTAQFTAEDGTEHAHAWTIGYRGDFAFATLIVSGEDSVYTINLAHDFLSSIPG